MPEQKLYSIAEVAKITGKAVVTVRMLVRSHNLGKKVGRDWVLTDDDIEKLRNIPGPGRPPKAD